MRHPQSLMSIKMHNIIANLIPINSILDQIMNILLELYHGQLGTENVFTIWWSFFVWENLGETMMIQNILNISHSELRFVFNLLVLVTALRRLPEFDGYQPQTFPGQL